MTSALESPIDRFDAVSSLATRSLLAVTDRDWAALAGTLEWSCRRTVEHVADCLFSYALQVAARAEDSWVAVHELQPLADASPRQMVDTVRATAGLLSATLHVAPAGTVASDGVALLSCSDWAVRGAHEVLVHTHDVLAGLGEDFVAPAALCAWVLDSPTLWALDRTKTIGIADPWVGLLLASGRPASHADPGVDHR